MVQHHSELLQPLIYSAQNTKDTNVQDNIALGTLLFEHYFTLKELLRFVFLFTFSFEDIQAHEFSIKSDLINDSSFVELAECYTWFNEAAMRWLEIAEYKAMERIEKAVQLDNLTAVDEIVHHSSSAVDVKTVLIQIQTFWKQLDWPNAESSFGYLSILLDVSI